MCIVVQYNAMNKLQCLMQCSAVQEVVAVVQQRCWQEQCTSPLYRRMIRHVRITTDTTQHHRHNTWVVTTPHTTTDTIQYHSHYTRVATHYITPQSPRKGSNTPHNMHLSHHTRVVTHHTTPQSPHKGSYTPHNITVTAQG